MSVVGLSRFSKIDMLHCIHDLFEHTFNLTECQFEKLPKDVNKNEFEIELPVSKMSVIFNLSFDHEEYKDLCFDDFNDLFFFKYS